MATPVVIMASGGIPVTEAAANHGTPLTPVTALGVGVTIVAAGGMPVTFISVDGVLWPGGVEPGGGTGEGLQFDNEINSQYLVLLDDF